jgi:hypothetical protein
MNLAQARAAIRRLIGPKAMWRYDEGAPSADERVELRMALPVLESARESARVAVQRRKDELLAGDAEYQRLRQTWHDANNEAARGLASAHRYRVSVGKDTGLFFHILAEGDNWQDAIDKLKAKQRT